MEHQAEYLLERGKPMPSKNHSKLESRLARLLGNDYEEKYDIFVELSLELNTGVHIPVSPEKVQQILEQIKIVKR